MRLYDGRPSGEMVLACGSLEDGSPADHLTLEACALSLSLSFRLLLTHSSSLEKGYLPVTTAWKRALSLRSCGLTL